MKKSVMFEPRELIASAKRPVFSICILCNVQIDKRFFSRARIRTLAPHLLAYAISINFLLILRTHVICVRFIQYPRYIIDKLKPLIHHVKCVLCLCTVHHIKCIKYSGILNMCLHRLFAPQFSTFYFSCALWIH